MRRNFINKFAPFQAYEAQYLRDFLQSHKSQNGQTILVDLHGLRREQNSIGARVYSNKRENAYVFSSQFLWDKTGIEFERFIEQLKERNNQ